MEEKKTENYADIESKLSMCEGERRRSTHRGYEIAIATVKLRDSVRNTAT